MAELEGKATRGHWKLDGCRVWGICPLNNAHTEGIVGFRDAHEYDAAFIAASRSFIPKAIAELRELRERNAWLRQQLWGIADAPHGDPNDENYAESALDRVRDIASRAAAQASSDHERLIAWCQMVHERLAPLCAAEVPLPMQERITITLAQDDYLRILGLARWAEHELGCEVDAARQG
jgi:hypothetical protein